MGESKFKFKLSKKFNNNYKKILKKKSIKIIRTLKIIIVWGKGNLIK